MHALSVCASVCGCPVCDGILAETGGATGGVHFWQPLCMRMLSLSVHLCVAALWWTKLRLAGVHFWQPLCMCMLYLFVHLCETLAETGPTGSQGRACSRSFRLSVVICLHLSAWTIIGLAGLCVTCLFLYPCSRRQHRILPLWLGSRQPGSSPWGLHQPCSC